MKKAIIDIDGILWDMRKTWNTIIQRDYPGCPAPGVSMGNNKAKWKFYEGYMTDAQMADSAKEVHMRQHEFPSFENAGNLTKVLQKNGYCVTIASHRDAETRTATEKWLEKYNIPCDELYTGFDKHFLLDEASIFIDDSPISQKSALDKGVTVFSIEYDYNSHVEGVRFSPDFPSLCKDLSTWLEV